LHSCTVEDDAFIGIGAIVLGRAVVRRGALVGAGAVVPPGAEIPAGVLALGSPARAVRPLTEAERDGNARERPELPRLRRAPPRRSRK
jgi:carbonic anhydrase/acetyltransferase-like protein (isoleucine patch superfamily)